MIRSLLFLALFGNGPTEQDISDLSSHQFKVRLNASVRLEKMGSAALPRLEKEANNNRDPEARKRCRDIVEIYYSAAPSPDRCPPICALPENVRVDVMNHYVLLAHSKSGKPAEDYVYTRTELPGMATHLYFRDLLYWGVSPAEVEKLRQSMFIFEAKLLPMGCGYHPCDSVAWVVNPSEKPAEVELLHTVRPRRLNGLIPKHLMKP